MDVKRPAAIVALCDTRRRQITVEDPQQSAWQRENRRGRWQPRRDWPTHGPGFILKSFQPRGEPGFQVAGQVVAQRNRVAFAVLLVRRVQGCERDGLVELQLRHGQGCQLAPTQAGQDQGLVNQRPFPSDLCQTVAHLGPHVGVALALARPFSDRQRFEQRPLAGHGKEADQFTLGHGTTLPAAVRLDIELADSLEGVESEPVGCDAPVAESHKVIAVAVSRPRPCPFIAQSSEPALERLAGKVFQRLEETIGHDPPQVAVGIGAMVARQSPPSHVLGVGIEMSFHWLVKLAGDGILLRGHYSGLDQLSAALQLSQFRSGGGLVSTPG